MARLGVYVSDSGVQIRQLLRTEQLPWSRIDSFGTIPWSTALLPPSLARFLRPFTYYGVGAPSLVVHLATGDRRVIGLLNGNSALVWLADKPAKIAARLNACRPPAT
jgi:hypothetical protein